MLCDLKEEADGLGKAAQGPWERPSDSNLLPTSAPTEEARPSGLARGSWENADLLLGMFPLVLVRGGGRGCLPGGETDIPPGCLGGASLIRVGLLPRGPGLCGPLHPRQHRGGAMMAGDAYLAGPLKAVTETG